MHAGAGLPGPARRLAFGLPHAPKAPEAGEQIRGRGSRETRDVHPHRGPVEPPQNRRRREDDMVRGRQKPPFAWAPTLYFAEGVPFFAISLIAGILYKRLGMGNDVIALYTKLLLLPWSLKPLWSPLLEMFKTKKYFVVLLQLVGGVSLAVIGLCLPLASYFLYRSEERRVGK